MGRPKREPCAERSTAADRHWNCGPEMGILTWRRVERVWIIEKPRSQRGLMRLYQTQPVNTYFKSSRAFVKRKSAASKSIVPSDVGGGLEPQWLAEPLG